MNEELIRQCAEEACGPEWYGPKPNLMRGGGDRALRLYHARHVAPLVEAAGRLADCASGFSVSGVYFDEPCMTENVAALEAVRTALAPFQQAGAAPTMAQAAADVLAERCRQIEAEGWTPEHDDKNESGDMARAAACYALVAADYPTDDGAILRFWPWLDSRWKPSDHRRNLVKAGALILAEIERIDRAAEKEARDD